MTIEKRYCPECNGEILFTYVHPNQSYKIENGEFIRNDGWAGIMSDNPYFDFYCSNDRTHDISNSSIIDSKNIDRWMEEIEDEFYRTIA